MSLSDFARRKAFDFAKRVYGQANPSANLETGSAIRSLLLTPFSLIYASAFQEIDTLRDLHLGNAANISETNMDLLAGNLLQERPRGSRSTTTVKMYIEELNSFTLEVFPYFRTANGLSFSPVRRTSFTPNEIFEESGELYVNVPVISTTYGPSSVASAGEIEDYVNIPSGITVTRVTNPFAAEGGSERLSNSEFLEYLEDVFNDGTLAQKAGTRNYIVDNYPEVTDIKIADSGDPLLKRDEVWTADGVNPNLSREGEPFAAHLSLGVLDFSDAFGRATGSGFTSEMEGMRIAIDGDEERFRTISKVIDDSTILISGTDLDGTASAELWNEGPHILTMSDVYMYTPALNIQSVVVDKRFLLTGLSNAIVVTQNRIYYAIADGFAYTSFPTSGKLVVLEGTDTETVYTVTGTGTDATGDYLAVTETVSTPIVGGDSMSFYDMSEIEIGVDIVDRPVLYVLQIDQLDPLSFEVAQRLNPSAPGEYSEPGWYINNTDPAEVFSAKESKKIILDTKEGLNAFKPISGSANVTDSSSIFDADVENTAGSNEITLTSSLDLEYNEGREIEIQIDDYTLNDVTSVSKAVSAGAGTQEMTITGLNSEYDTTIGYRDDARVIVYDNNPVVIGTYEPGEVMVYGDKVKRKVGAFGGTADSVQVILPAVVDEDDLGLLGPAINDTFWVVVDSQEFPATGTVPYLAQWDGAAFVTLTVDSTKYVRGQTIETIILTTNGTTLIEVFSENGLPAISDKDGLISPTLLTITAVSEEGGFNIAPVRVTYATNTAFGDLQNTMDSGDVQLLTKDTLIRSFFPTLIDATVSYSGSATSEEVYNKFVDLIQEIAKEVDAGQRIRLDMSNIIAALDEDGFTDSIDVNFEVRVTNYLSDGEFEVRYLNPAEETVQELTLDVTTAPGADRVVLQRYKTSAPVPGRGKLFLGDKNPSTQEVLPYEAVIQNSDSTLTFVLRNGYTTTYSHPEFEGALVSVRDYDPEYEFTEGAIYVPANNRPYVRQLVVIRQ